MRIGVVRGQRQRLCRGCLGRADLAGTIVGCVHVDFRHMGVSKAQKRVDVVLVEAERGFKKTTCLPRRLERPMSVPGSPPVKSVIDGVESVGMLASRPAALRRDQLDVDLMGQAGGDLVLHVEEIGPPLVEALGPKMRAAFGVDELRVESSPLTGSLHAAFEDVSHAELAADLAGVDRFALIGESGAPRDRPNAGAAREVGG
jgi:hypothetical protein